MAARAGRQGSSPHRLRGLRCRAFPLQPGIPRLHRIIAAIELAQIGEPTHRQAVRILLAGLDHRVELDRHLGTRLVARRLAAIQQQVIDLHDPVDRGFHGILS